MEISNIRYINELDKLIHEIEIDKENICLTGSAPLAAYGIRENSDIDFLAINKERENIKRFARGHNEMHVAEDGKVKFNDKVEMSRDNRYETIGLSDQNIINGEYHFELNGYKILRPEAALSMKGTERRPKDVRDLQRIENSGLLESEGWNWDWDKVILVPPWERPSSNRSPQKGLIREAVHSIRENGVFLTGVKAADRILPKKYEPSSRLGLNRESSRVRVGDKLEITLPELLSKQYDQSGEFVGHELVASILAAEGDSRFEWVEKIDHDLSITQDGALLSGAPTIANEIVSKTNNDLSEIVFSLPIKDRNRERSLSDISTSLTASELESIKVRKQQLLRETGASFFAILWPPLQDEFDKAEEMLRTEFSIYDSQDYHFKCGFGRFVRDLYSADKRNEDWFRETKLNHLKKYDPQLRVLSLEVPRPTFRNNMGHPVAQETHRLKMDFRMTFRNMIDDYLYGADLHMTDNFDHNVHLRQMLDSIDNGKYPE